MNPSDPRDAPVPDALTIDCASCAMQHSDACDDCVVTFICSRDADDAVVIGVDEVRTIRMLGEVGLVPRLRHRRRTG